MNGARPSWRGLQVPSASTSAWQDRAWLQGLVLVLAVALSYLPAWHAGFTWDDDMHLTANPCIVGPKGFLDIWTSSEARICPLVLSTFWLEHKIFGLNSGPYHVVNILLHAGASLALWRVLLTLGVRGAWLGAALWALHPVQVESVAWITELKNTQSGWFFLLSVLFFVRMLRVDSRGNRAQAGADRWNYGCSLLFALLGMASKTSVVVLPLVLALCAWWMEKRLTRRRIRQLMPVVVMSLAAAALALWTQHLEGANDAHAAARGLGERVATAGAVVGFYLGKLVWPHPLVFIYPKWKMDPTSALWWLPLLGLVALAVFLYLPPAKWKRSALFALLYFVAALIPVLGILDHYFLRYSFVGDHFQYLASMGPMALLGAGLSALAWRGSARMPATFLTAVLLVLMSCLTWKQQRLYQSIEVLWSDTLAHHPDCWLACNNLGLMRYQEGRVDEAMDLWRRALVSEPCSASSHSNLGHALFQRGATDEAMAHFAKALECDPDFGGAQHNYGRALIQLGRAGEGLEHLEKAVKGNPGNSEAHLTLGGARLLTGDAPGAISEFERAMELSPGNAAPLVNLAWVLATHRDAALRQGNRAVELATKAVHLEGKPGAQTLRTLAAAYAEMGDFEKAADTAGKAANAAAEAGDFRLGSRLESEARSYRMGVPLREDF